MTCSENGFESPTRQFDGVLSMLRERFSRVEAEEAGALIEVLSAFVVKMLGESELSLADLTEFYRTNVELPAVGGPDFHVIRVFD